MITIWIESFVVNTEMNPLRGMLVFALQKKCSSKNLPTEDLTDGYSLHKYKDAKSDATPRSMLVFALNKKTR